MLLGALRCSKAYYIALPMACNSNGGGGMMVRVLVAAVKGLATDTVVGEVVVVAVSLRHTSGEVPSPGWGPGRV